MSSAALPTIYTLTYSQEIDGGRSVTFESLSPLHVPGVGDEVDVENTLGDHSNERYVVSRRKFGTSKSDGQKIVHTAFVYLRRA